MNTATIEGYELSPQQKRLWFLLRDHRGFPSRVHCVIMIEGHLDIRMLNNSLQTTIDRFEILRTTFHTIPGMDIPLQVIGNVSYAWLKSGHLLEAGQLQQQDFEAILSGKKVQNLDQPSIGGALATLYTLSENKHVMLLNMPSLWLDWQGIDNMFRELACSYPMVGSDIQVATKPIQYAALAARLNESLNSQNSHEGSDYWNKKLAVERSYPPFRRSAANTGQFRPLCLRKEIALEVIEKIEAFTSDNDDVSIKSFLLTCFAILIWHLTRGEDVVIGTVCDGRTEPELRDALGLLARCVPITVHLEIGDTFHNVWRQVLALLQEANSWQDSLSWKDTANSESKRTSLNYFPLCFEFGNGEKKYTAGNVTFTLLDTSVYAEQFELKLSCKRTPRGLICDFYYDEVVLSCADVERFAEYFSNIVKEGLSNTHIKIEAASILSEAEWQELVSDLGKGRKEALLQECVHHAFEKQVALTPQNIALVLKDKKLTYAELNAYANRLAQQLQGLGVKPEMVVALCVERSVETIIGLLGILKAGGVYVPLDPSLPKERLAFIIQDNLTSIVVTQEWLAPIFDEYGIEVVNLDIESDVVQEGSGDNPVSRVLPENLAYLMYTSGSTGKPKGVEVSHKVALNHFMVMRREFNLSAKDRVLQFASTNFDVSLEQIFPALLTGATVVMRGSESWSVAELCRAIADSRLTVVNLTPAYWHLWSQAVAAESVQEDQLRLVIVGGEAMTLEALHTWQQASMSRKQLLNAYGPTEATITATIFDVSGQFSEESQAGTVPIGKPLPNRDIYILNRNMEPAPKGIPGELYIGGELLARGYFNRPDLTTEQFVPDPFSDKPGARLYKTGDIGRYLPTGEIEYLGRVDQQVKIRGFRIEPREIEEALEEHAAVQSAIVIDREDKLGEKRLVAYVVLYQKYSITVTDLRSFLDGKLPRYMVPSAFVFLDALPLTINGKVARNALPAPATSRPELKESFVVPRSIVEKKLAEIWCELLDINQVGIHDNFFELGGHSLVAAQVIFRIRETYQVHLPMRSLFETPTINELAGIIAHAHHREHSNNAPIGIVPSPSQRYDPFFLTDLQQAYWVGQTDFFELGQVSAHTYTEIECVGLDITAANFAFRCLIERHDMLRAIVLPDGQQQVLNRVPPYEIEFADLRSLPPDMREARLQKVREHMSHTGPKTDHWPLFEIRGHQLTNRRFRLHISVSLLLIDARTEQLLLQEWLCFYRDPSVRLKPLEITYRDYLRVLKELEDAEIGHQGWQYWMQRLNSLPPAPELPLIKVPKALSQARFVRRRERLEPETWLRLKTKAHHANLTPNTILCTAYAETIAKWSKTAHFTINILSSNRLPLHPQVNDIVGNLSITIPLEIDCRGQDVFMIRCQHLQQQLWNDIEHSQVSGVRFIREVARFQGWTTRVALPIVFASSLNLYTSTAPQTLVLKEVYGALQTPQVYLDHQVAEEAGALVFNWDAIDQLFPEDLLDAMFAAYCGLLRQLANEETCWYEVPSRLIAFPKIAEVTSIQQAATCDVAGLLHTPFLVQAALRPTQLAIITSSHTLTYSELAARAQQVAQWLYSMRARPNTLVAVVMEKGWEQVVAVLGILQIGAAYVPIDPSLPQSRLYSILEHAKVTLALTQSWIEEKLNWPGNIQRWSVDQRVLANEIPFPVVKQKPEDLAYVIYTSGSTGLPKGVAIDHRGGMNTIADLNERFCIGPADRVLALSSLSFDLSVYDIFGTLAAGATMVIPDASSTRDPAHWVNLLMNERVTIWNSVPALMELLVEHVVRQNILYSFALRLVLLSGDWIPVALPDRVKKLVEGVRVISLGGATEASIWSILYPIDIVDPSWKSIPYGRSMLNQAVYVMDENLMPCPTWVTGQLYIGGVGVAKGYWRDEEKTHTSFIVHPDTGARLYRTGDFGRYLSDGNIEFLGREDSQIKIQGYRIELGEIETALNRHPAVKESVVNVQTDSNGKALVAYIVFHHGQRITMGNLRSFLQETLPDYMVPATFVVLEKLPLTSNGKVDRRALPATNQQRPTPEEDFVAPRTPLELRLRQIWESILDVHPVGVTDNFFELGGNSFSALRLMAQVTEEFGKEFPLSGLFQGATIGQLATLLSEQIETSPSSPAVGIQLRGTKQPFFCVHPIGGNVLCYVGLARYLGLDRPFYGLESVGLRGEQAPFTRIEEMAARYIAALRSIQPQGPYAMGGWSMGGVIAFEMAQQLSLQGEDVVLLALIDCKVPVSGDQSYGLDYPDTIVRFVSDLTGHALAKLPISPEEIRQRTGEAQDAYVLEQMQRVGLMSQYMGQEQFHRLVRIFEANTHALMQYIPHTYSGRLTLLRASLGISLEMQDETLGWGMLVPQVDVYTVPGDHYTIFAEPYVGTLARQLRDCLEAML